MKIKEATVVKIVCYTCLTVLSVCCLAPFILVLISSFSSEQSITLYGYSFFPESWSLEAYRYLFRNAADIFRAYGVSIFVTVVGTVAGASFTLLLAYPLSRPDFPWKNGMTLYVFITMLFNGGLVPTYIMYSVYFGIKNTILALILPNLLMNGFNVMMARTYFTTNIPMSVIEAASIDGAGEFNIFKTIVLPLSRPIVATIALLSGIIYWNDWNNGLIYITDYELMSIQQLMNNMLTNAQFIQQNSQVATMETIPTNSVRMAIAIVGSVPLLLVYPFFQKYYVKGVTVGAVKE